MNELVVLCELFGPFGMNCRATAKCRRKEVGPRFRVKRLRRAVTDCGDGALLVDYKGVFIRLGVLDVFGNLSAEFQPH
jgi:hypothetical protein